jgi:hypothetical protein
MHFELNRISPEENAENHAQNEQSRRSGDSGDIYSQRIIVITIIIIQFFGILLTYVFFISEAILVQR